ncbi:MAG TPA: hypothetical protein VL284_00575 [Thermoanaerobaculia bacterium]|nr:hypothetical protein [Thermoanaerobaculia bacterium]
MKRLVVALLFVLIPTALFAQVVDRDVLVAPNGTLYTIESVPNDGSVQGDIQQFLRLTVQSAGSTSQTLVPESTSMSGVHWRPALAYDSDSSTLFVFWLHMPNAMSSELLLAAYTNGQWQKALSIDNQPYRLRFNLQVGITRKISQLQADGTSMDVPMLMIHAIWWEETGYGELARYAVFDVVDGQISALELHNLDDFAPSPTHLLPNEVSADFNPEILRHPAFADSGTPDSIDVIYGDMYMKDVVRVRVKPIEANGRIHIPIGAHPGGPRMMAPVAFSDAWTGSISTIAAPHDDGLLFYNTTAGAVNYIVYSNGSWSAVKSVPLSQKLSADAAVAALSRMMSQ